MIRVFLKSTEEPTNMSSCQEQLRISCQEHDVVIDNAHDRNESNNETNMRYAKNENSDVGDVLERESI
jgi:hypothetical protein